jgi:hypothetical protein
MSWTIQLSNHFTAMRLVCCEYYEYILLVYSIYIASAGGRHSKEAPGILLPNLNKENNL